MAASFFFFFFLFLFNPKRTATAAAGAAAAAVAASLLSFNHRLRFLDFIIIFFFQFINAQSPSAFYGWNFVFIFIFVCARHATPSHVASRRVANRSHFLPPFTQKEHLIWSAPSSPLLYLLYCVWLSHASGIRSGDWLHLNVYTSTQFKCQLKDIVTAIIPSLNQTHCSFSSLVFLLITVTAKSQVLDGFRGWSSWIQDEDGTERNRERCIYVFYL